MASVEDPATVLEQFMHDAANLPAEISHMMEEIQAKDREMQKYHTVINAKDSTLQKHLKLSGSLIVHPKEREYSESILKHYDLCQDMQDQKISLSDKACTLLDRQVKLLDMKIRELQNDGQLLDGPPIPSIFNRKSAYPDSARGFFAEMNPQSQQPLQATSGNAAAGVIRGSPSAQRLNSQHHPSPSTAQNASSRLSQLSAGASAHLHPRNSAPATPALSANQLQLQVPSQRHRETSAGANEHKKRRLNLGLPAQSSTLRQSSLGPGTPKAGTPTGGTSRAGSAGPRSAVTQNAAAKKSVGLSRKMMPHHQQITKLKGKPSKRLAGSKRKGKSPSVRSRSNARGGGGGGGGGEEESIISSADDTDASTTTSRSRRGGANSGARATPTTTSHHNSTKSNRRSQDDEEDDKDEEDDEEDNDIEMADASADADGDEVKVGRARSAEEDDDDEEGEEEEEEEQEDNRKYCFCQKVSYGEMVGCENDKCPYEWFHLNCVGLKEAPRDQDIWYCPKCRPVFENGNAGASGGGGAARK